MRLRGGRPRRVTRSVVGFLIAGVLAACLLAGCTSARNGLGTSDSSCYGALPAATKAAGSPSRLLGVHLFKVADLRHQNRKLLTELTAGESSTADVCAVAFSGHFTAHSVRKPHGRTVGHVAIVVLARPSNRLLGTAVLRRLPLRFAHSHIG